MILRLASFSAAVGLLLSVSVASPSLAVSDARQTSTPTVGVTASLSISEARALILDQTNSLRAQYGLPPLRLNTTLHAWAQDWSQRQAAAMTMSHRPNFTSGYPAGWLSASENVAAGYSASNVVAAWAGSPGHRANLLSASTDIGIGVAVSSSGRYFYTQNFARYPLSSAALPSAPVGLGVTVNDGSALTLQWQEPERAGLTAVSGYIVQFRRSTSTTWSTAAGGVISGTSFTFVRPTPGVTFVFRVVARNSYGSGVWSSQVSATTPTATPSAPAGLAVTVNDGSTLTLQWQEPSWSGLSPVSDYVIQFRRATSTSWTTVADGVSALRSFTFVRPTPGVTFVFRVVARNSYGSGVWSSQVSATTPTATPSAPAGLAVTVNDGSTLTLQWQEPSWSGLSPVSDYVIQFRRATSTSWTTVADGVSALRSFTFVRPTPGVTFVFRVVARNSYGSGVWSSQVSATTPV
jgi:uncharacterized protein YkwD